MDDGKARVSRTHIFVDESGNLDFTLNPAASRYFTLTSVAVEDCSQGSSVTSLRRDVAWDGKFPVGEFHCSEDRQVVRDEVFAILTSLPIRIYASLFEKSKVATHLTADRERFLKTAQWMHLQYVLHGEAGSSSEIMIVSASLGTRKQREREFASLADIAAQLGQTLGKDIRCGTWPAASDPLLQVADYCCWAIQRKYELGDARSFALIAHQIVSVRDVFGSDT